MDVEAGEEAGGNLGTDAVEVLDCFLGEGRVRGFEGGGGGGRRYFDEAGFGEVEA